MAEQNHDNAAYLDFIQSLNEILMDFDINRLSCSYCVSVFMKKAAPQGPLFCFGCFYPR